MAQSVRRQAQGTAKGTAVLLRQALFVIFLVLVTSHLAPRTSHLVAWAAQIYPKAASKKPEPLTAEKLLMRLDRLEDAGQQLAQAMSDIKSKLAIIRVRASSRAACP